jgi:hypothetical protein
LHGALEIALAVLSKTKETRDGGTELCDDGQCDEEIAEAHAVATEYQTNKVTSGIAEWL